MGFPEGIAQFVMTPLFIMQSEVDWWQIEHELGIAGPKFANATQVAEINSYRVALQEHIKAAVATNSYFGAFIDSCMHHGYDLIEDIRIGNVTLRGVFKTWYQAQKTAWTKAEAPQRGPLELQD